MPPQKVFHKKGALNNFAILTEKHRSWSLSFNQSCRFYISFPVNIAKFLRTPILKNIWEQLLLD